MKRIEFLIIPKTMKLTEIDKRVLRKVIVSKELLTNPFFADEGEEHSISWVQVYNLLLNESEKQCILHKFIQMTGEEAWGALLSLFEKIYEMPAKQEQDKYSSELMKQIDVVLNDFAVQHGITFPN